MQSDAQTVEANLAELTPERRTAIETVRKLILDNLPQGYGESMQFGMIAYSVPLSRYPDTYNARPLSYVGLASQKNHMSLYLMGCYGDATLQKWFEAEFKKAGKTLDMGKSCLRFRKLDDIPLPLIGEAVAKLPVDDFIALYERSRPGTKKNGARKR